MRVVVTGGTGFIGTNLVNMLVARGYEVTVFSRRPGTSLPGCKTMLWPAGNGRSVDAGTGWLEALDGAQAVINLAGESIAGGRWSAGRKKLILSSGDINKRIRCRLLWPR